jgi:peptide/nickel transport system permease protein
MLNYLIRRLLIGLVTLLLITFVIYALIRHMPGSPLTTDPSMMDPSKQPSEAQQERLIRAYGLDKPWYEAYFIWFGNLLQGDLDRSFREKRAVTAVIADRIGPTLTLSLISLVLSYLLAVPLGLYATVHSGQTRERILSTSLYALYSIPSFVAGLLLLIVFYVKLQGTMFHLPADNTISPGYSDMSFFGKVGDRLWHLVLPVFCATYGGLAYYSRFVKSNMEEVIRQDYIRTARAKGVSERNIIVHHAFRNTLIPFATMIGLTLPGLLSGFVILESVFSWPGMGLLFLESIGTRDYPVIMGLTLMFSILTLLGQLLADILYAVVDPRVTYS